MSRIAFATSDARPAYEPTGVCASCGCRGTYARATRQSAPPVDRRYCRRCWPAAHRQHVAAHQQAVAAWFAAGRAAAEAWARSPGPGQFALPPGPPGESLAWHWSLALGTHWREWRLRRPAPTPLSGREHG